MLFQKTYGIFVLDVDNYARIVGVSFAEGVSYEQINFYLRMSNSFTLLRTRTGAVLLTLGAAMLFFILSATSAFAAAPTIASAIASDQSGDGTVDRIVVTFGVSTADIDDTSGAADGFTAIALNSGCTIANADYTALGVTTLTFSSLTGCTANNTAITPSVTYTAVANCTTNFSICNATDQLANAATTNATDGAKPVLTTVVLSSASSRNRLSLTYTEAITATNGASTTTKGDITSAGTVAGFGSFATAGNVTVASLKNTVGGSGTSTITIDLADQAGAFLVGTSATEPSGNVTPLASASVVDAATNQVNTAGAVVAPSGGGTWDLTKPTITSVTTNDIDNDGRLETATIVFNSSVRDANITNGEALFGGATHTGTFATGTANDATTVFTLTTDDLAVDTSPTGAQFTYTPVLTSITDAAGNLLDTATDGTIVNADIVETDGARPVLVTISPLDNAAGVLRDANITLTFSEIVASLTYTMAGDATTLFANNITAAAAVLNPNGLMSGAYHVLTISTAPDAATNTFFGVSTAAEATVTNPFNFNTAASSSSANSSTSSSATYDIDVTSPNGGETLIPGSTQDISWSSSGGSGMSAVNVNFIYVRDGVTYQETIVTGTTNDGAYSWTVPSIDTSYATIQVVGNDLAVSLATDASDDYFTIGAGDADAVADDEDDTSSDEVTVPSNGTTGASPVTGEIEAISSVSAGMYIRSPFFNTVYFIENVDGTLIRRSFMDAQTFMTYEDDWSNVETVTDATLPTLSLGGPMLPNDGVVLVKIQTVPKVYAIEADGTLRWITSEAVAISNYGSSWANYVIDIPDTLFPRFDFGTDIESDENPSAGIMKTRMEVNM